MATTMSGVLTTMKALFDDIDPSPQDSPSCVLARPDDIDELSEVLTHPEPNFPIIVISRDTSQESTVITVDDGLIEQTSPYSILVFLADGLQMDGYEEAELEKMESDWIIALSKSLYVQVDLCDPSLVIQDRNLFTWRSGHIHASETREFWGLHLNITLNYEMSIE